MADRSCYSRSVEESFHVITPVSNISTDRFQAIQIPYIYNFNTQVLSMDIIIIIHMLCAECSAYSYNQSATLLHQCTEIQMPNENYLL